MVLTKRQLQILRLFARQSDPARDADGGAGRRRGAAPCGSGIPQHPARRGRTSEIRLAKLPRGMRARRPLGSARRLARSRPDGDGGIPPHRRGGRGGVGGVSGDLRPRHLRADAHRGAEAEF